VYKRQGQSITGLGQADQVFNGCQYPTALLDGSSCADHDKEGGGKKRQGSTCPSDGVVAPVSWRLTPY